MIAVLQLDNFFAVLNKLINPMVNCDALTHVMLTHFVRDEHPVGLHASFFQGEGRLPVFAFDHEN